MRPVLLLCLLSLGCSASAQPRPLGFPERPPPDGFERVWYYRVDSRTDDPRVFVVCRPGEPCPVKALLDGGGWEPAAPASGEMLLGVGEQFPTGGYALSFTRVGRTRDEVVATYTLRQPGASCGTFQVFTFPNEVVRIPYTDLPVRFVREVVSHDCEGGREG